MARSGREKETTDTSQHQENITATRFIFFVLLNRKSSTGILPCQTSPCEEKRTLHFAADWDLFLFSAIAAIFWLGHPLPRQFWLQPPFLFSKMVKFNKSKLMD